MKVLFSLNSLFSKYCRKTINHTPPMDVLLRKELFFLLNFRCMNCVFFNFLLNLQRINSSCTPSRIMVPRKHLLDHPNVKRVAMQGAKYNHTMSPPPPLFLIVSETSGRAHILSPAINSPCPGSWMHNAMHIMKHHILNWTKCRLWSACSWNWYRNELHTWSRGKFAKQPTHMMTWQ